MTDQTNSQKVKQKQIMTLLVIAGAVLIVGWGLYSLLKSQPKVTEMKARALEKKQFISPLEQLDTEKIWNERVENKLTEAFKKHEETKQRVDATSASHEDYRTQAQQMMQKMGQDLTVLTEELRTLKAAQATSKMAGSLPEQGRANESALVVPSLGGIRQDTLPLVISQKNKASEKNVDNYVPSGTFAQALVLGGADASAAVGSQGNPKPMQFQIQDNGTLPNHYKSRLKGCIVTAAVAGDISSERGEIRLETLSCVRPDKSILDLQVQGTVYDGQDGKNAMWGNPVWREGAMVQRAAAAGLFSGFADALSQTYTTNSISPLGSTQTINTGAIMQYSAARGAGNGLNKLSDYYIARAEQYHPVIQLPPGGKVTIAFTKGFFLEHPKTDLEKQDSAKPSTPTTLVTRTSAELDNTRALPLTEKQVQRLQEHQAELGFVTQQEAR